MPQIIYKIGLFLLVFFLSIYSIELSFITSVFVLAISFTGKANINIIFLAILLTIVAVIGLFSSYGLKYPFFDILKDIIYFVRPVTVLLASYFVVKRIKSQNYVFNVVILMAFIFAVKHLFNIVISLGKIDSYIFLRSLGGKQNHIETVALIFLFFTPFNTLFVKHRKLVTYIIVLSFVLYLSRTMFIILFVFFLAYKGYLFLNKKFFKGIFVILITSLALGIIISNIDTNRDSQGIKAFIYKTQNSFKELFAPIDTSEIVNDRRLLWEHWRAYEANKAIEQISESGAKAWLIGMGFGSQIDLETYAYLDGKTFTEVPTIHNGFVNVLFKTGILGLIFYLLFIFYSFFKYQKPTLDYYNNLFNKLIVATSLYMLFNSFVITGFYRPGEFSIFLLGILIASKQKFQSIIS